jgi:beta-glucosidase
MSAPTVSAVGEPELASRLAALTLEQKVRLLTGADFWSLHPEPAIGLRRLVVSDGPAGVRGERWDERDPSANVPSPTALAATWDEDLVERLGGLLAFESRRKGVDVLLAPTVNLHRTPYGGRHFECFSEDPLLTARIGVAYVRGLQAGGVGATVKHFVANDSETERMTLDVQVSERALRELYLAPFEAIVRAGVWSVMAAYNGVDGEPMSENRRLREILQDEWAFDGVTMSDWFGARRTVETGRAGLDLAMPGPAGPWGDALVAAVRAGEVPEAAIDDKVRRVLRLAARVGALEGVGAVSPAPAFTDAGIAGELRRAAAAGFVLARNEGGALPLAAEQLRRLAVLGPNAAVARTLGGGSATVFPPYTVSPLEGIRAALGERVELLHASGGAAGTRTPVAGPPWIRRADGADGVDLRFLAADGAELARESRPGCAFNWLGSFAPAVSDSEVARLELHARLRATDAGTYAVGVSGLGRYTLAIGGETRFAGELALPAGADMVVGLVIPPQAVVDVALEAGEEVDLLVGHEVDTGDGMGGARFQLNLAPPHESADAELERAVALAREADAAVVVVGTTEEVESEGFDRASLALPGRQDELVRRVAQANPRTIVVVNAGAPVLLPWAEEVGAVLLAWFGGQEVGNALADVLLGAVEPGGRLPTTWPIGEEDSLSPAPVDGVLRYDEGLFVGYRAFQAEDRPPRFAFGHGLGYTTWELGGIEAPARVSAGTPVTATVTVRNTGARAGRQVVQVYASRPASAIERPVRWLAGFAAVEAEPDDERVVAVPIAPRTFEHWDEHSGAWAVEEGRFALAAGFSCAVLAAGTEVEIVTA